jgi:hypothetical protein
MFPVYCGLSSCFRPVRFILLVPVLYSFALSQQQAAKNDLANQDNAVREATIRYQILVWSKDGDKAEREAKDTNEKSIAMQLNARIYFISINGKDPNDDFLNRFHDIPGTVKKASAAKSSSQDFVVDRETGRPGIVFKSGEIKWISPSKAEVRGGYYCGSLCAAGQIFELNKDGDKWKVTAVRTEWIS